MNMKGMLSSLVALALLLTPLAVTGLASAAETGRTQVIVETGTTDRFGGGDYVWVKSGDAVVAVLYGTTANPNRVVVFAEFKRFLGGADIVDERGNPLGTRGVPVFSVVGQSLDGLAEFVDTNGDGLLNFRSLDNTSEDTPVKLIGFRNLAWTLDSPTIETANETTYVNFTVSARNVPYDRVWPVGAFPRSGIPADGVLDRVAFRFELRVDVREITADVPWFRVTVSDGPARDITRVERLENRTLTGPVVAMGAKYDHAIDGWDFADRTNKLALQSGLLYGNYIPERVVDFVRRAYYHDEARDDGGFRRNETVTTEERPTLLTRDYVYFNDNWVRVGRFVWVSDVLVDGVSQRMFFQVQGGGREIWRHGGAVFVGFHLRAAYIYPIGQSVFHDPGLDATAANYAIGTIANLTPVTLLVLQLVIVGVAIGPALWLRARGRARR